jgi:hypothetical protein
MLFMSITKKILEWNDKRFESIDMEKDKNPGLKAFSCGVVEGAIDSAVIWYPVLLASCYYWKNKALKK